MSIVKEIIARVKEEEKKEEYYSVRQVSSKLKIHYNTVLRYIQERQFEGVVRIGGRYKVPRNSVKKFIDNSKI